MSSIKTFTQDCNSYKLSYPFQSLVTAESRPMTLSDKR